MPINAAMNILLYSYCHACKMEEKERRGNEDACLGGLKRKKR